MSDIAIRVEHLGKQYKLGGKQASYSTFRETLVHAANAPLRWLKGERRPELNEFWALDDVSFEVKHGEALGIIGRNGAGKSTLLKILSRITSPTRGRVDIYGRVGSLLEVGTGFHPELSGRENIFLNGAILGMSRVEIARKFDEIVDFSGVEKFLDTPVKHYSSGMYVRLAFAVAAHLEPEILVVDEVLAVGDAEFQKKCLGKMDDVAHQGRTVLFVSHNMGAIKQLCSRTIYLEEGFVQFDGVSDQAIQKYKGETRDNLVTNFESDPNKIIRIRRLEVCSPEQTSGYGVIDTDAGVKINITYNVNKPISGAHIFIRVHMSDGETLLSSGDADTSPNRFERRNPGEYNCHVVIPPRILGVGEYSISCSAGIPYQENFDLVVNALSFHVEDNQTKRGKFIHKSRPGLLALDLEWKYENEEK